MNSILTLGIAMAIGLLFNRIVTKIHLPNVTGYLVAGLLFGPSVLGVFSAEDVSALSVISTVALGFIAFSIGGEFKFSHIKQIGGSVLTITFFQAFAACAFVDVALILLGFDTPLALVLGAIATATAPAATLMVVRQYKAKGPVTNILLPVVALDDAIGLVIFSISLSIAKAMSAGGILTVSTMLLDPLKEIVLSLLVGGVLGGILTLCVQFFHSRANRISLVVAAVFLGVALADMWHLSSLLLCMAIGAVLCNMQTEENVIKVMDVTDRWTPPLFLLFFVISGAELELAVLPTVGLLGAVYLLSRSAGKYLGAYVGAAVVKAEKNIRKYLGVALLPQAGVAIGMTQIVSASLPEYATEVRAVILCATLIYELVGPLLTKIVLQRAGEIKKESAPADVSSTKAA